MSSMIPAAGPHHISGGNPCSQLGQDCTPWLHFMKDENERAQFIILLRGILNLKRCVFKAPEKKLRIQGEDGVRQMLAVSADNVELRDPVTVPHLCYVVSSVPRVSSLLLLGFVTLLSRAHEQFPDYAGLACERHPRVAYICHRYWLPSEDSKKVFVLLMACHTLHHIPLSLARQEGIRRRCFTLPLPVECC